MSAGWKCPNCGKAHAQHVETCPEPAKEAAPFSFPLGAPYPGPFEPYDPRYPGNVSFQSFPYPVTTS